MKELNTIQTQMHAPKGQRNKFGNYNYRSCEDIQEAVKPFLKQTECTLVISDEVVAVLDRVYVKATATLTNAEGATVVNTAYAREAQTKKGMDDSQITGATSSYARKYALNGLFCIDDTKDADAINTHGKEPKVIKNKADMTPWGKTLDAMGIDRDKVMFNLVNSEKCPFKGGDHFESLNAKQKAYLDEKFTASFLNKLKETCAK